MLTWHVQKGGDQNVRPEQADHLDHLAQCVCLAPMFIGLFGRLGKSEVTDRIIRCFGKPADIGPDDLHCLKQLFTSQIAQRIAAFRPQRILAALTAHGIHIHHMHAVTQRQSGQHARCFIIGMRPCLHEDHGGLQRFQPAIKMSQWLAMFLPCDEVLFHRSLALSWVRLSVIV